MNDETQHDQQTVPPSTATSAPANDPQPPEARVGKKIARFAATPISFGRAALLPRSFEEVWRLAVLFSRAGEFVPAVYRDNPSMCATAIAWGMELGLSPLNAIASIAPIKGRAALWGDGLKAVAMNHADYVDCIEVEIKDGAGKVIGWECTAKRRDRADITRRFTMADAERAGLTNRDTPWKGYGANRMCMFRARGWALRDQFPDALRGIYGAEEAIEADYRDVTPAREPVRMPEPVAAIEQQPNPLNDLAAFGDDAVHVRVDTAVDAAAESQAEPPPRAEPKPLTSGQRTIVNSYLTNASKHGITQQDVMDELGDVIHQGNYAAALDFLTRKITEAANAGATP